MMAYFQAFELKAYQEGVRFPNGLILDLGCGEGTFAQMLRELLDIESLFVGGDCDRAKLVRAARRDGLYVQTVGLDASHLPFKEETFDAVLSNAVLYNLRPTPEQAVREVQRVLKKGGEFIITVPTHLADQHYWVEEFLRKMRLVGLAHWYRQRMNQRMGFVSALRPDMWCKMLEASGLSVQTVIHYISGAVSRRWSVLAMTPLRLMGGLRMLSPKAIHRTVSVVQKRLMAHSYRHLSTVAAEECGDYLLIVSEKSGLQAKQGEPF